MIDANRNDRQSHMQILVNASHPKTAVANNALQHCCSTQSLLFYLISVIVLGFFISGSDELVVGDHIALALRRRGNMHVVQPQSVVQPQCSTVECNNYLFIQNFSRADLDLGRRSPRGQLCTEDELHRLLPVVKDWSKRKVELDLDGDKCLSQDEVRMFFMVWMMMMMASEAGRLTHPHAHRPRPPLTQRA